MSDLELMDREDQEALERLEAMLEQLKKNELGFEEFWGVVGLMGMIEHARIIKSKP